MERFLQLIPLNDGDLLAILPRSRLLMTDLDADAGVLRPFSQSRLDHRPPVRYIGTIAAMPLDPASPTFHLHSPWWRDKQHVIFLSYSP